MRKPNNMTLEEAKTLAEQLNEPEDGDGGAYEPRLDSSGRYYVVFIEINSCE